MSSSMNSNKEISLSKPSETKTPDSSASSTATTAATITTTSISSAVASLEDSFHLDVDEVYDGNHFIFHTAIKGDTLHSILRKYAPTTECEIRAWNEMPGKGTGDGRVTPKLEVGEVGLLQIIILILICSFLLLHSFSL